MTDARRPVFAGSFYPADPTELRDEVRTYLGSATPPEPGTFEHFVLMGKLAFHTALGMPDNGVFDLLTQVGFGNFLYIYIKVVKIVFRSTLLPSFCPKPSQILPLQPGSFSLYRP